ncbi:hypothetical protein M433DRAFT_150819 [Acidomyces richmondensis BFW]|nr:MAG: hypothetical protein FE78DRAFT_84083 [Acidomyces sp. 'richmondensis']KYG48715.1 hypothetical protein M433DRAFT_150819 [Acidomyces richmondensis BFW]
MLSWTTLLERGSVRKLVLGGLKRISPFTYFALITLTAMHFVTAASAFKNKLAG